MLIGTDRSIFTVGSAVRERIVRFSASDMPIDSIVFSTKKHGLSESQELSSTVHAYPTNAWSRLGYIWNAIRIARTLPRPDIVSAQDPFETGLAAFWIARYWRVPFVVEVHTDFLAPAFARHSFLNRIRLLIARFVLPRAAGGYTVSARVRDEMIERYSLKTPFTVQPIYIDLSRYAAVSKKRHPRFTTTLVWVGRFEREKNPMEALRAFAIARKNNPGLGLVFVGDGSLRNALVKKAKELHVDEWVEWTHTHVTAEEVASFYAMADLVLVTSEYEGYGMVIVEALAAGVPVLATDVGIAREAGAGVVTGDYATALIAWLQGPREQGKLLLRSYANEAEYFAQVSGHYKAIANHP